MNKMSDKEYLLRLQIECKYSRGINWEHISSEIPSDKFAEDYADEIIWSEANYENLSEDTIAKFENLVDWNLVSSKSDLSDDFIRKYADKLDWDSISSNSCLSYDIIKKFQDRIEWSELQYKSLPIECFTEDFDKIHLPMRAINRRLLDLLDKNQSAWQFLLEFKDKIDWSALDYECMRIEDIEMCIDYIDWHHMFYSCHRNLPIEFIRKYRDKIMSIIEEDNGYLDLLCFNENLIREFSDMIENWTLVSWNRVSLDLIRDLSDKVGAFSWRRISCRKDLTEDFIEEFAEKLYWKDVIENNIGHLSKEFLMKFMKDPSKFE